MSAALKDLIRPGPKTWLNANVNNINVDETLTAKDVNGTILQQLTNGTTIDNVEMLVTSDGIDVSLDYNKVGSGPFDIQIGEIRYTVPAGSITITAGSDISPTNNYIYIVIVGGVPEVQHSTSDWPTSPHVRIATTLIPSATFVQTKGPYNIHKWVDEQSDNEGGHIQHINRWIRNNNAIWLDGAVQSYFPAVDSSSTNVTFGISSGTALQLHEHAIPAFSIGTFPMYAINDPDTAYREINDLADLLKDSTGASLTNRYYSLILWVAVNYTTADSKIYVNLPSGSYNNSIDAENDPDNFNDYSIPKEFRDSGILLSRLRLHNNANTTYTNNGTHDLRGRFPNNTAGGSTGGGTTTFADNSFSVFNVTDSTKKVQLDVSGVTPSTTRTLTIPDASEEIALQNNNFASPQVTTPSVTTNTALSLQTTTGNKDITIDASGTGSEIIMNTGGLERARLTDTELQVDQILENTADAGVTIEGTLFKDQGITLVPTATSNVYVDGSAVSRTEPSTGQLETYMRSGVQGAVNIHSHNYPNGFNDTIGMLSHVDLEGSTTNIVATGMNSEAILTGGADNYNITSFKASKVGPSGASGIIRALDVREEIDVVTHSSGAVGDVDHAWIFNGAYVDVTTNFASPVLNVQMFVNDNDYIYLGQSTQFTNIEVLLAVSSSQNIQAIFEYSQGAAAWNTLAVNDLTEGFQDPGSITFDVPGDWATDNVNGTGPYYWVRIQRTRNALPTPPTEATIRVSTPTVYSWDKNGDLDVNGIQLSNDYKVTSILDEDDMISDSDTALATQQSIKAYVDASASPSVWQRVGNDISPVSVGGIVNINQIKEESTDNGVLVDNVLIKDGTVATTSTLGLGTLPSMTHSADSFIVRRSNGFGRLDISRVGNQATLGWIRDDSPSAIDYALMAFGNPGSQSFRLSEGLGVTNIFQYTSSNNTFAFLSGIPVTVAGSLKLATGASINEFSTDGTLAGNSDLAIPTEKAVKTYVDSVAGGPLVSGGTFTALGANIGTYGISLTANKLATGHYQVSFSPRTVYGVTASAFQVSPAAIVNVIGFTTGGASQTSFQVYTYNAAGTAVDTPVSYTMHHL